MELLKGKRALVTGGTAGIGRGIAIEFARQGAEVIIFGTNEERAKEVVKELSSLENGGNHSFFIVDVSNGERIREAIHQILKGGDIDILVNNAGITRDNLLMKMSEEDWDLVLSVNLKSVYHTCRALIRPMMKKRSGSIINISSVVGLTGNVGQGNYAASKSGVIGLTKSLAEEVAKKGVRVNCIAPGFIETRMTDGLSPQVKEALLGKIPMGKMGTSLDIAHAAVFLASGWSEYMTGQVLTVDGGMVR